MKKPLISICMTNYNYEKFLKEALDSVFAQTYDNFEVVIIDNASTDNSVELIKSFQDDRLRLYVNEENIPLYQNLNNAQSLAQGEFIAVLHSDDKYEDNFLEEVVNYYNQYPTQKVFVTGVNHYHHEINRCKPWFPYKNEGLKYKKEVLAWLIKENNIGNGVNVAYHRECLDKVGMFSADYRYAGDYDLWLRLACEYDFVFIPKILAYYRIHSSNLSHTVNKNMDMVREGENILNKFLLKNKSFSLEETSHLKTLHSHYKISKIFDMGVKYKSGCYLRKLLEFSKEIYPNLGYNPLFHFINFLSYPLDIDNEIALKSVNFLGKAALYHFKKNTNSAFDAFAENARQASILEKIPKKNCSGGCGSCKCGG